MPGSPCTQSCCTTRSSAVNGSTLNAWYETFASKSVSYCVKAHRSNNGIWIRIRNRQYVVSKSDGPTKYERERTGRPRNPLALVVLTSDGQVQTDNRNTMSSLWTWRKTNTRSLHCVIHVQLTTLYKPAGQVFTHISTNLPRRSVTEDLASSRITHGSLLSGGKHPTL